MLPGFPPHVPVDALGMAFDRVKRECRERCRSSTGLRIDGQKNVICRNSQLSTHRERCLIP